MAMGYSTVYIESKPQGFKQTIKTTKFMFNYILKEKNGKSYAVVSLLSALFNIIPMLINTIFPGMIITELMGEQRVSRLALYVGVLVVSPIIYQMINKLFAKFLQKTRLQLSAGFTRKFELHSGAMDLEALEDPELEDEVIRVSATIRYGYRVVDRLTNLLSSTLSLVAIFSIIATINAYIVGIILFVLWINSLVIKRMNEKNYENAKKLNSFDRFLNMLIGVLTSKYYAKDVRLYDLKEYFSDLLFNKATESNEIHLDNTNNHLNSQIIFSVTNFLQQVALYAYLIYSVLFKGLTIGNMSIYMSAVSQFASSFNSVMNSYLDLAKESLDIQEVITFLQRPVSRYPSGDKIPEFNKDSVIEFKNVSFKYLGTERMIMKNFNFKIRGDQKLCIVGENGSGKSTFISLLTRLYDPIEGEILLDGVNICEYDKDAYRKLFAPVLQDFMIYPTTLGQNIALAREYNEEKLMDAATKCGLAPLVNKLPKKFDEYVYRGMHSDGFEPSGGEAQKIAIARAIYHGASIFLLDEPTAALDPLAECEIYENFNNITSGSPAIYITHRLSAVQMSDIVAVFSDGQVIEYDTHKNLYNAEGVYREMFDKQGEFYRSENGDEG